MKLVKGKMKGKGKIDVIKGKTISIIIKFDHN